MAWIRIAFIATALVGGLGILCYLACWLIIPQEGEQPGDATSGWIVILAQACAACVGVAMLGVLGAVATLFGFGWLVAALAAIVLLAVLVGWPRLRPGWALLPVAALVLPSVAIAASGLRLVPDGGDLAFAPRVLTTTSTVTYRSGVGTMLVDLRRTELPAAGIVSMRIDGGVRRTIVALPTHRCVHVVLSYDVRPFVAELAAELTGDHPPYSGVDVFGRVSRLRSGHLSDTYGVAGPVLKLDFTSAGGSLYVRDYPDTVDPEVQPDWPGYQVFPEQRPDTTGVPKRAVRRLVRAWRARRRQELRSKRLIDSLLPGPCAAAATRR